MILTPCPDGRCKECDCGDMDVAIPVEDELKVGVLDLEDGCGLEIG